MRVMQLQTVHEMCLVIVTFEGLVLFIHEILTMIIVGFVIGVVMILKNVEMCFIHVVVLLNLILF